MDSSLGRAAVTTWLASLHIRSSILTDPVCVSWITFAIKKKSQEDPYDLAFEIMWLLLNSFN